MHITRTQTNPTTVKLTVTADLADLTKLKDAVLTRLSAQLKIAGFRPGKAPLAVVERNVNPSTLQSEFLETAVNELYGRAADAEKLRAVGQPKVELAKFVPFSTLEFTAEVEAIGEVKLPDYKKLKLARKPVAVTDKDIEEVVHTLQRQTAEKKEVKRAAKDGDEVVIDFEGKDAKTNEPIKGAAGKAYPLALGSDTFIPGFESNLVGLKAGEEKTFTLTFPKDYGVSALQNRKVSFTVTVQQVNEVVEPQADDAFAAKAGPFKSMEQLRGDIHTQLSAEKEAEAEREYENELLEKIAASTDVAIPSVLIDEEVERTIQQTRQNLVYRGQTWQEFLEAEGKTDEAYRADLRAGAELRVKVGIALSEVAEQERLTVTPEELKTRLQQLKSQYADKKMQEELEKPSNVRAILSRMLSEKVIAKLVEYSRSK